MTIEERLENMERELGRVKRRNCWLLGAIFLVVGGLIAPRVFETAASLAQAQGAETAKQVRARSFILEDEKGKLCAMLAVTKAGSGLTLWDEDGRSRAGLVALKDAPSLSLSDENGRPRAEMTVLKEGPGLSLSDENGKGGAGLSVFKQGPSLVLLNKNGNVIWSTIK
jgi:hypothetical protein